MFRLIEKIRSFMYGRNGIDRLGMFTMFMYLLFNGVRMCFWWFWPVYYSMRVIAILFLALTIFRILSKNVERRRYEASCFERLLAKIHFDRIVFKANKKLKRLSVRLMQVRTHRFRTCPQCKEHLRLSKKRGLRKITCPICGRKFKRYILF